MKNNTNYLLSAILVVLVIGMVLNIGMSKPDTVQLETEVGVSEAYHDYLDLTIEGQVIRLDMQNGNGVVEFQTLNVENDLSIMIAGNSNFEVMFDGVPRTLGEPFAYRVAELNPDYTIPIIVRNTFNNEVKVFQIKTWPDALERYRVTGKTDGAWYITTFVGNNAAYKVDGSGKLLYYRLGSDNKTLWDFKKVETKDGIRYLLFEQISTPYASNGYGTAGEYIVYDEQYHEIKRLRMVASDAVPNDNWPVDQHEVLYVSDSEYCYEMTFVKWGNSCQKA